MDNKNVLKDFLERARKEMEEEYGDELGEIIPEIDYSVPSEKAIDPMSNAMLDNVGRERLEKALLSSGNCTIGRFILKIHRDKGAVAKRRDDKAGCLSVSLYEKGDDGLDRRVQMERDYRFREAPFLTYFDKPSHKVQEVGKNVPIEDLVLLLRWLQAINNIGAFI